MATPLTRLLLLAALGFSPSAARAEDLSDSTQGWSTDIKPAKDWEQVTFTDENGDTQSLFYRTSKFSIGVEPPATGDVPLFKFDPNPESSELSMDGHANQIRTFKDNQLSVYYIKAPSAGGLNLLGGYSADVSRRDKPELSIHVSFLKLDPGPIDFSSIDLTRLPASGRGRAAFLTPAQACLWCSGAYPAPDDGNWTQDYISRLKVIVYTPTKVDTGKASPITAALEENACEKDNLEAYSKTPPGPMGTLQQLWLGFIPTEVELMSSSISQQVSPSALAGTDKMSAAISGLNSGAFAPANAFIADTRTQLQTIAGMARSAMLTGQPEAKFSPFESRWLVCRIRHQGAAAKTAFKSQLDDLDGKPADARPKAFKKFVADWRRFLIAELAAYDQESQNLPAFPDKPDHAALDLALHARTRQAVNGAGTQAAAAAPPRIGAPQVRRVDSAAGTIDDILNQ
jgi:hypothetical protein